MYCVKCGNLIQDGAKFCGVCGSSIEENQGEAPVYQQSEPILVYQQAEPAPLYQQPEPAPVYGQPVSAPMQKLKGGQLHILPLLFSALILVGGVLEALVFEEMLIGAAIAVVGIAFIIWDIIHINPKSA